MKTQYKEGLIKNCKKVKCSCSCCDDDQVQEWANEYFAFHERIKDYLISKGIKIVFKGDRVWFRNCSDGKNCKFIDISTNKDIDLRPIDCKIYPYVVDWDTIDFDNKIVNLYFWDNDCPLVRENKIPDKFQEEVKNIIKRDFYFLFYGTQFEVKFIKKIHG
jgi:hypothetical protein